MTDDFLRDAQAQWRATPGQVTVLHARLRRTRWVPHLLLSIEVAGALVAFLVGLFYVAEALRTREFLFILSAVALLSGMPLAIDASIRIRRDSLRWEEETPDSIVSTALRRAEASLKIVRLGRLGIAAIVGFTLLLWLAQAIGLVNPPEFLLIYTGGAGVVCLLYHWHLRRHERKMRDEQVSCQRLLAELEVVEAPSR